MDETWDDGWFNEEEEDGEEDEIEQQELVQSLAAQMMAKQTLGSYQYKVAEKMYKTATKQLEALRQGIDPGPAEPLFSLRKDQQKVKETKK